MASTADESSTMLVTLCLLSPGLLSAFLQEFVQKPLHAATLINDRLSDFFESHVHAQDFDPVAVDSNRQTISRLQAKLAANCRREHNPATFTKNHRFSHNLPPKQNYAIIYGSCRAGLIQKSLQLQQGRQISRSELIDPKNSERMAAKPRLPPWQMVTPTRWCRAASK